MRSAENPYAGQGPVLLDVGGEVGALLVMMPASWEGVEIEIRPKGQAQEVGAHAHGHQHDHAGSLHSPDVGHTHRAGHTEQAHLTHVEVLPRPTPGGPVHCAVFPDLVEGRYELSQRPFGEVTLEVTVVGGQIAQASWPMPWRDAMGSH